MLVGVSQKYDFNWKVQVVKFPNLETAEAWLKKEQYDFRERYIFDSEEEALEHLKEFKGVKWAKSRLEDASTMTLLENGQFDEELSSAYVEKMLGGW